jgi:hypothetical protein
MKRSIVPALFIICLTYSNTAKAALSEADCRRYADEAVAAANWQVYRCGFRGGRWSNSWNGHFGWCMSQADNGAVYSEWSQRNQQIADCKNADSDCLAYSNTAISQQWTNINLCSSHVCGGPRWSYNRGDHESWCLRVSPQQRRDETTARARQMCGC